MPLPSRCPCCGKEMHRVPEVIDCWFDSGSMPFAQYHYPFENQETFKKQLPGCTSSARRLTRPEAGSTLCWRSRPWSSIKAPYKNVIVLGHVQDENGQKMSKSKGNAVDPLEALQEYGADAIRWYFYINSAPWLPNRFHGTCRYGRSEKVHGNSVEYLRILRAVRKDRQVRSHEAYELEYEKLSVMDKWLLSKLNTLIGSRGPSAGYLPDSGDGARTGRTLSMT